MRARGATLIEIIVVIIISGILVVFIAPILATAVDSYDRTSRNIEVLTKMRYAMERISREIRSIRRDPLDSGSYDIATALSGMTAKKLQFCRSDGTRVTIDNLSLATEIAVDYTSGFTATCTAATLSGQTLTDSVTLFNFTYLTITGAAATGKTDVAYVDIDLRMAGTGTSTYLNTMRVDLRNP